MGGAGGGTGVMAGREELTLGCWCLSGSRSISRGRSRSGAGGIMGESDRAIILQKPIDGTTLMS